MEHIDDHPLIGSWEYQSGQSDVYLISEHTQQSIDYMQPISGSIQVSGAEDITFKHFTSDRLFWSGTPNYLLTEKSPWLFPIDGLRLFDTSGTRTADLSIGSKHYYSDSIAWEYSKLTGELHIPQTLLFLDDGSDSVTVFGDATVPMLILEAGTPTFVFSFDSIYIIDPFQKIEFKTMDSISVWKESSTATPDVGMWQLLNDTLSINTPTDSVWYYYEILEDTLWFASPKIIDSNLWTYEMYGDLEPSSLLSSWGILRQKYCRSYESND